MTVDRFSLLNIFVFLCLLSLAGCDNQERPKFTGNMVLAISWQPGFCETRRKLAECRSQTPDRLDATRFSLHGLWPQPGSNVYCGVEDRFVRLDKSRQWLKLPSLTLSEPLRAELKDAMPGVQSGLHRHEWIKHGTCYSADEETYYRDSLLLLATINGSRVGELFRTSVGKQLSSRTIRESFDQAFGRGAGERVRMACRRVGNRTLITELTIGLSGDISSAPDPGSLILASPKTKPGCPRGIVDAAGFQ